MVETEKAHFLNGFSMATSRVKNSGSVTTFEYSNEHWLARLTRFHLENHFLSKLKRFLSLDDPRKTRVCSLIAISKRHSRARPPSRIFESSKNKRN